MKETFRGEIDRVEGDLFVCYSEDDRLFNVPVARFPDLAAGDQVMITADGKDVLDIRRLDEETDRLKKENQSLFAALLRRKKK